VAGTAEEPDAGWTVVEVVVAMTIASALLAAVGWALVGAIGAYSHVLDESLADDRGRVILDRVDRDLRQVSSVNLPERVGNLWFVEYLTDVKDTGNPSTCTQWRLDTGTHTLDVRSWTSTATEAPQWGTAATGVVNDPSTQPPFTVTSASSTVAHQQLTVELHLRLSHGDATSRAAVTARNSSTASPSNTDADGDGASDTPVCTAFGRP
jgi:Tfp pilus assembly protein PilW